MVVTFGDTTRLPVVDTGVPSRSTCAALLMPHWRVELAPRMIFDGVALKGEVIVGHAPTGTVNAWLAVCAEQSLLVTVTVYVEVEEGRTSRKRWPGGTL